MVFFPAKPSVKEIANERLKLILINDRHGVSPELLEMIKLEILDVISKYFELDEALAEIKLSNTDTGNRHSSVLVASMPIKRVFI